MHNFSDLMALRETSLNALVFSLQFQLFGIILHFELFKISFFYFYLCPWGTNCFFKLIILVIVWRYTKPQSSLLPGTEQKVCCGGWLVVVCKPILIISLGFDQAEQLERRMQ
jgi:hypothetical protein